MTDTGRKTLTLERIADCCRDAISARDCLGPALAGLWLTAEHRAAAEIEGGVQRDAPGACSALLVWNNRESLGRAWELFTSGFILPLRWSIDVEDSRHLPQGMSEIANDVRRLTGHRRWGLGLGDELAGVSLFELRFSCDSAWIPLAAGLEIAVQGGRQKSNVFATGAWRDGIAEVEGFSRKVSAVKAMAEFSRTRQCRPTIFAPASNVERYFAKNGPDGSVEIVPFPVGEMDWRRVSSAYLARLEAPPAASSAVEEKLEYANRPYMMGDHSRRSAYYREALVGDLAQRLSSEHLRKQFATLALALSKSWWLSVMLVQALKPEQVVLLCTNETRVYVGSVRESLGWTDGSRITVVTLDTGEEKALEVLVDRLGVAAGDLERAVEITSGTKAMTALLLVAARRTGAAVFYLEHETRDGAPIYGTEHLRELGWARAAHREAHGRRDEPR